MLTLIYDALILLCFACTVLYKYTVHLYRISVCILKRISA
jgi:hypothetical protein